MASKGNRLSSFASILDVNGILTASGGSITVYNTFEDFPVSGTSGEFAYNDSGNVLYIYNQALAEWKEVATINQSPIITGGPQATEEFQFGVDSSTPFTLIATDPEGVPLTWSYNITAGSLGGGTITQQNNVFTYTMASNTDSISSFDITFAATDGVNIAYRTSSIINTWGSLISMSGGTGNGTDTYNAPNGAIVTTNRNTYGGTFTGTYSLQYMFDGIDNTTNVPTYWLASIPTSAGSWLLLDFSNTSNTIARMELYPKSRTDNDTSIVSVEASPDNINWTVIPNSSLSNPLVGEKLDVVNPSSVNKYFRINLTYTGSWGVTMNGIRIYGI